jgi:hypothetical protein
MSVPASTLSGMESELPPTLRNRARYQSGVVSRAIARDLTDEARLGQAMSVRTKLRWRADLHELIVAAAGGDHSVLEFRYHRDVERAHGLPESARQAWCCWPPACCRSTRPWPWRFHPAGGGLFSPLRWRVQRAVDRRFNRARYDADKTVAAFAARLKDAVELDTVRADLASVVTKALEPAHVSVWMSERRF